MSSSMRTRAAVLSTLVLSASAQLLSCSDVKCPVSFGAAKCNIDNTTLTELGVANFSSSLSPNPLTWTIGYAPKAITHDEDQRRYYLSTPRGLNLNSRTDVAGCALFFTGVEADLSFVQANGTDIDINRLSGTCADALGSTCESDLINQAHDITANLTTSGELQCADIAQALQYSPPTSCTKAGTWGNVTAKSITGPDSPSALQLNDCNPTTNMTYDVRSVATFLNFGGNSYANNITPLMTIFASNLQNTDVIQGPEVHLNCMKPIEDSSPDQILSNDGRKVLTVLKSLSSTSVVMAGLMALAVFAA